MVWGGAHQGVLAKRGATGRGEGQNSVDLSFLCFPLSCSPCWSQAGQTARHVSLSCPLWPQMQITEWPRFSSVRLRFGGGKVELGSIGSGFRFRRFLYKKGFPVFQYIFKGKTVPVSVPGKRFRRFRFRFRFRENGSDGSGFRFRFSS